MQNTIAKDSLSKNVKENEMALAKGNNGIIKKGDTFVQYKPRHSMIFMKVNDVGHTETMDFCTVTWHMRMPKDSMFKVTSLWRHPMACS